MQKLPPPPDIPPNHLVLSVQDVELQADPKLAIGQQYFPIDLEQWLELMELMQVERTTRHQRTHSWTLRYTVSWVCQGAQPEIVLDLLP